MSDPRIAIAPVSEPGLEAAVTAGGGALAPPDEADGLIWVNPRDPQGLKDLLASSPARWVQLPFAGIESFVAAGVLDPSRTWTCTKGAYGHACAEHALGLMLAASRRIFHHARAKEWEEPGFGSPERRLKGSTVLIFGTGGIGRALVPMLLPLEVRIIGLSRSGSDVEGVERVARADELPNLIGQADYVVICAALTKETRKTFDAEMIGRMKENAWLINVARGGLVVTDDLVAAVQAGEIGGAALDVTDPEPLPAGHPLWDLDNVIITPHIANTWDMAIPELREMVKRNVAHLAGHEPLEGLVDTDLGY
jgi:D-3-phosphoglycerate dehydrogenase